MSSKTAAKISDFLDNAQVGIPLLALLIAIIFGVIGLANSTCEPLKISAGAVIFAGVSFFPLRIAASKAHRFFWHKFNEGYPKK